MFTPGILLSLITAGRALPLTFVELLLHMNFGGPSTSASSMDSFDLRTRFRLTRLCLSASVSAQSLPQSKQACLCGFIFEDNVPWPVGRIYQ